MLIDEIFNFMMIVFSPSLSVGQSSSSCHPVITLFSVHRVSSCPLVISAVTASTLADGAEDRILYI